MTEDDQLPGSEATLLQVKLEASIGDALEAAIKSNASLPVEAARDKAAADLANGASQAGVLSAAGTELARDQDGDDNAVAANTAFGPGLLTAASWELPWGPTFYAAPGGDKKAIANAAAAVFSVDEAAVLLPIPRSEYEPWQRFIIIINRLHAARVSARAPAFEESSRSAPCRRQHISAHDTSASLPVGAARDKAAADLVNGASQAGVLSAAGTELARDQDGEDNAAAANTACGPGLLTAASWELPTFYAAPGGD
ncbi:uncharacterized protein [Dermacentor albipictus]|uniref:uncharacterized protein n=1 Tax=Dermacentor albipictus TaxID=60249 RepID=UPI0038FC4EDE